MNVPNLAPNLFEMKEKKPKKHGKNPHLRPFVLLRSLSSSSAHFRPLPFVLFCSLPFPSPPPTPEREERERTSSERLWKSGPNYYTKRRGLHCRWLRLLVLSGRLLLRGQDLFINAPALLSLPLDNTDGLFSHDHEVSPSLRLFPLSSLLRIIICLSKLC
jgi:hypothetical protein